MNSKSRLLFSFVKEADEILSKLYATTPSGEPITPNDQTWHDARDRLIAIKVGSPNNFTYPVNWIMAEQLIMDELTSRPEPHEVHIELEKSYHGR
jgi:hypothetical protein